MRAAMVYSLDKVYECVVHCFMVENEQGALP
jgi:hypothetical protein